ncbi:MAG: ATP-binding protein [Chitinophagaceae bacterium]
MNAKLRFTLIFSALVSIVVVLSGTTIYFLYAQIRKQVFNDRLTAQAQKVHEQYRSYIANPKETVGQISDDNMFDLRIVVFNSNLDNVKLLTNQKSAIRFNQSLLFEIQKKQRVAFSDDKHECVGISFNDPNCIILIGAFDKYGLSKQEQLKRIIILAIIGGIISTAIIAFIFIGQITKPLNKFNSQMERISESNLNERMPLANYDTDLNRTAQAFNAMLDRLQQAFEFQKSFVHHASHELRTPLASMLSHTEAALSRDDLTLEEAKKVLVSLKEDQQEMIDLTNSLLLLSQYAKLTYSTDWPLIRIDEILYELITAIKRVFTQVNIALEFAQVPDDEMMLSLHGNDALLRSAFRNLIKNAYQYSTNQRIVVTIDADAQYFKIHIDNQGQHVAPADQERLFIPFFRGQNAQRKKGFGLGLSIVKRIVELHQGTIHYTALPENINRFTVQFKRIS